LNRRARSHNLKVSVGFLAAGLALVAAPRTGRAVDRATRVTTAQPATDDERAEARRRFDRGLALYNSGDLLGALAEFQRAHRLTGHPLVLYNMALVEARLGHSAAAVTALELLAPKESELGAERAERARQLYQEQLQRVGTLEVVPSVAGATIQIDDVDVDEPTRVARVDAGNHLVSLWAPGYEPRRVSVLVAGGAREVLPIEMIPLEAPIARLRITSNVVDVEVRDGKELLGKTPLSNDVALPPGRHALSFSRSGYAPELRSMDLAAGARAALNVELRMDALALSSGALLTLSLSEGNAVVLVDGEPHLDAALGMRLPLGRHQLHVARAGFFDVSREVALGAGRTVLDVTLIPTPAHLAEYTARAKRQRLLAFVTAGAGAAVTAGAVGFLVWNQGKKNDAETRFDAFASEAEAMPKSCDKTCVETSAILVDDLDAKRKRDVFGWIGVGVGAAAIGAGVLLYVTGDDPSRYEPKSEGGSLVSLRVDVGPGHVALRGAF
jgi:hypothetical protein